ncbi:ATP-grasp domain-containing protein [Desulfoferrobacter suflitae]|uniref:ATP-grasp domain-containing protein n=1 Tax=Desulfoferrobacter suflitae TaxID=2865782 RepID=UPI002164563B|nr:hypothetical protein [Desulfoferrobacter suflitae]MCK8604068.1 hypothetical protein [Desulfoferrobacter suflitae]
MKPSTVLGVFREQIFSPGKVQDDAAILDATLAVLSQFGCKVSGVKAEALQGSLPRPDCVLNMAQSARCLEILDQWEAGGTQVINSAGSIRNCYRKPLIRLLLEAGVHLPPSRIVPLEQAADRKSWQCSGPVWLKRGDVHAMQSGDVVFSSSHEDFAVAVDHFRRHHVLDILVQDHVQGRVVKFYGVGEGEYFRAFCTESGEELTCQVEPLTRIAAHAARTIGLKVYGGDAVLTSQNKVFLIDLNDWPSFSRCRSSAAESIASYVINRN